jgi:serine-type D-Ala-D-Ala carboxypeptidase
MISRPRVTFTLPGNSAITPQVRNLSVNKTLNNVGTLAPAWDQQDALFARAFSLLREPIEQRAFPAASVAVTHGDGLVALKAFGHFTYDADSPATTSATLFDLASVSKVVATTAMAMVLYERGRLDLDAPLSRTVPEFLADASGQPDPRRREVRLRMLLAHSSGLPAYKKLFLEAHSRDDLLQAAFRTALSADPGERVEYSDIGFILLAAALERIANESLDAFCRREIFQPLSMIDTTFNPPAGARGKIPPTADDRFFRKKIIQGEVQDENSSVLGGVSGHAGLFSTAQDLTRFAHAMLQAGHPILRRETVSLFTRRESLPTGTSRALGWDTPSASSQSGKYFGSNSFGHLGYTGTSLWIDPERRLSITLLTNRTWPDCANWAIKQVRPKFHDAVVEALMGASGLRTDGSDAREIASST